MFFALLQPLFFFLEDSSTTSHITFKTKNVSICNRCNFQYTGEIWAPQHLVNEAIKFYVALLLALTQKIFATGASKRSLPIAEYSVACVASVSTRVRRERWDESEKKGTFAL